MIELVEVDFNYFHKFIYKHYIQLFPSLERTPLKELKKEAEDNILKFISIKTNNIDVGFLIYCCFENNPYIWLDYFAIYKEYQNKLLGSKAIEKFKTYFEDYAGIYGEIASALNDKDEIFLRKIFFYKRLGFEVLDQKLYFYGVIYNPCVLKFNSIHTEQEILNYGIDIYKRVSDEEDFSKNFYLVK